MERALVDATALGAPARYRRGGRLLLLRLLLRLLQHLLLKLLELREQRRILPLVDDNRQPAARLDVLGAVGVLERVGRLVLRSGAHTRAISRPPAPDRHARTRACARPSWDAPRTL
eukprot:1635053-Prymnesium_polylepis.1